MADLLLRTTIATLVAFGGGTLGIGLGRVAPRRLNLLVYLALGGLLAITLGDVLPDTKSLLSWPAFGLAVGSGFVLFWMLTRYVSPICPACAFSAFDPATGAKMGRTVTLLLLALSLHCAMDGLAVVIGDTITGHPNLFLLLAVSLHKLPEGLALALLLLGAGYSRRSALLWTLAVESLTEVGALIGIFGLRHVAPFWLGLVFAHVGGGFLYLVTSALGLLAHRPAPPSLSVEKSLAHEAPELYD